MYSGNKVKLLHVMVSKTNAYVKSIDGETKWVYSLIEDDDVSLWNNVSAEIKIII